MLREAECPVCGDKTPVEPVVVRGARRLLVMCVSPMRVLFVIGWGRFSRDHLKNVARLGQNRHVSEERAQDDDGDHRFNARRQ
jgi:hypothetical protein